MTRKMKKQKQTKKAPVKVTKKVTKTKAAAPAKPKDIFDFVGKMKFTRDDYYGCKIKFDNGYGISIIKTPNSKRNTYEIALMKGRKIIIDEKENKKTKIYDFETNLSRDAVVKFMKKIMKLKP